MCFLEEFLKDEVLIKIAQENGTTGTSFIVCRANQYLIRWFSSIQEIDLCWHGALAAAHVLRTYKQNSLSEIEFYVKVKI